jgi:hypothetical protein
MSSGAPALPRPAADRGLGPGPLNTRPAPGCAALASSRAVRQRQPGR